MGNRSGGLLILGGGGHAKVVLDAAKRSGRFTRYAVLDDYPHPSETRVLDIPVIGDHALLERLDREEWRVVVAVGDNATRRNLAQEAAAMGWRFARVIHPSAQIGEDVEIGEGTVVLARAVVNASARIGRHVILNSATVVEHDCIVGDFVHLAPASCVTGAGRVDAGAVVGARATVLPGRQIGVGALVGAGAVVTRDVLPRSVAVGIPARPLHLRSEPSGSGPRRPKAVREIRVAVTGVGGGVGQAILRSLWSASFDSWVLGLDMNARGAGLYLTDEARCLPPCGDPEYVPRLLSFLTEMRVSVLIPGSDPELPVLARARGEIESAGIQVVVGAPEPVDVCRDKRICSEFYRDLGFPFVRTCDVANAEELAREVGYPLVVKPVGGSASRGVAVVFSRSELEPYLGRTGMIAQEAAFPAAWRRGANGIDVRSVYRGGVLRQEDEISIQVVYDHLGHHLGTFTSVNRLQSGVPVFVDPQRIPEVESLVEKMANVLRDRGLIGPCNFQCRLTDHGPKVFEINPRYTGITGVRAAMGFNEVDAVLRRVRLDAPLDSVRGGLDQPTDRLSMRYVDELIVSRKRLEEMCE